MQASEFVETDQFQAIREYIRDELCQRNELERDAFQMAQRVLKRHGKPCGFYFCIYGPRSVRLTAVWDLNRAAIYFYDSLGRRAGCHRLPADCSA